MDEGLSFVVELNESIWARYVADTGDLTPEEADWRPLPEANSISVIVRQRAYGTPASGARLPLHFLGFHQATHLASHLGQIRALRNLYRTTRGEAARFHPNGPTYPR